ncbi:hypothetical protein [Bacillus sp. FSL K6-3431]
MQLDVVRIKSATRLIAAKTTLIDLINNNAGISNEADQANIFGKAE